MAKSMVTTSNHVLVNMADFGNDLEIESDVLAAKRSHDGDDTSDGERNGTSGTQASSESDVDATRSADAEEFTTHQDHQERMIHLRSFSGVGCGHTKIWCFES